MTTEEILHINIARDAHKSQLSRLEKFACAALTGLLANPRYENFDLATDAAARAFRHAEAMYAEFHRRSEP